MDNFQWRLFARIVAFIDLVFSFIALTAVGLLVVSKMVSSMYTDEDSFWMVWIILALMGLAIFALSVWTTMVLIKATKLGAFPLMALENGEYWLTVNTIFFVVAVVTGIAVRKYWQLILPLVIRLTFLYTVHEFVKELKRFCYPPPPTPQAVA